MKLDAGDIKDLVQETERKRADWAGNAVEMEKMWALNRFDDNRKDIKELDGLEAITTPDPFNIVQLVTRFIANEMRVEIPYLSAKDEDDDRSTLMEEWLMSFWQRSSRQQGRNLIEDMTWQSAVRGRGAMQIIWIADVLPKNLRSKRLPILARTLDPLNVGIHRGPYWTEHAYHKYKASRSYVRQQYPRFELPHAEDDWKRVWGEEFEVIDFVYMVDGSVWHAVTIDGKFAKEPVKTDYPEIPIIEWMADGAPVEDEAARSLSILYPIKDLWKYKCELASKIGTGLLYYFDPLVKAMGISEKIDVGPGATVYLQGDQNIDFVRPEPNVPMAEKMLNLIQTSMDQATFPAVLYGEQPGGVQAGFAISNLAQQARGRVNTIRGNLEGALEAANELILAQVEAFAGDEGVEIWGKSPMGDRSKPIKLSTRDIKGNWANEVRLIPEIPTDETGRIGIWLQMVEKGIISKATMRNRGVNLSLPRDEELRVTMEQVEQLPEMQHKRMLRAIQKVYKQDDWERILVGIPALQQMHEQEMAWQEQKEAEAEAAREARRQEKMQREQEALMQEMAAAGMMPGTMPPGMPTPPPGMMDPGMMQLPPGMGAPISQPGMPPGITGGGMPEMGMPPQGLPGIPPEAAGMMTPEMMGIPPGGPPGQFQQMMGEPLSDDEMLQRLMGPQGPPM